VLDGLHDGYDDSRWPLAHAVGERHLSLSPKRDPLFPGKRMVELQVIHGLKTEVVDVAAERLEPLEEVRSAPEPGGTERLLRRLVELRVCVVEERSARRGRLATKSTRTSSGRNSYLACSSCRTRSSFTCTSRRSRGGAAVLTPQTPFRTHPPSTRLHAVYWSR
jgi:hypothetical protein